MAPDTPVRLTYIGCGKTKRDEKSLAANLYTSTYFQLKRKYAARMSDSWAILSAKYGVLDPFTPTEPYDRTMTDYPIESADDAEHGTTDQWADSVLQSIEALLREREADESQPAVDEIVMLAGKPYLTPLREGGGRETLSEMAARYDVTVRYPFDQTSGIGEQMGWCGDNTDESQLVSRRYAAVFSDEIDASDGSQRQTSLGGF